MSTGPIAPGSPERLVPPDEDPSTPRVVQQGDTLGGIARQLQAEGVPGTTAELVRALVRLNGIADPDRIEVGQVLTLPRPPTTADARAESLSAASPPTSGPAAPAAERGTLLEAALLRLTRGWNAAVPPGPIRAPDGTPLFRQGDPAWRTERLGAAADGPTLAHAGCAVTACAMALSRMSGTVVTPDALVRHLRSSGGFQGPLVDWSAVARAVPRAPRACPGELDCSRVDRELEAGRPVLLRVVHEVGGSARQHWICLTARDPETGHYTANDPATGRTTALIRTGGGLVSGDGEAVRYASDGRMVAFAPPGPSPA